MLLMGKQLVMLSITLWVCEEHFGSDRNLSNPNTSKLSLPLRVISTTQDNLAQNLNKKNTLAANQIQFEEILNLLFQSTNLSVPNSVQNQNLKQGLHIRICLDENVDGKHLTYSSNRAEGQTQSVAVILN